MKYYYADKTKEKLPFLTKGLKKVANHLLEDPMVFATHPAKKVGSIIGVSETMVIRFCNQIGYSGYSDLQKEVRENLLNLSRDAYHQKETENIESKKFLHSMLDDLSLLKQNIDRIDEAAMGEAIELIIDSEKILVVGYYHSFSFAHWFSYNLNLVKGNADLYRPENDADLLDFLPENSCLIIFSFYRYALDTIRIAEAAKSKGIKIIAITDSWTSPITEFADIVISLFTSDHKTLLNKGPVTISFMNSMLFEVIKRMEGHGKIQPTYKYFIKDGEN
ncbi:MurR/RpiR family transcriptional regulator [Sutcliffiella cohnii]|uniref:MurR/RpiR family transcriptional regulator n=1 Tax=Sutcliffiella cohnii TaxID=33932 RepID=UPI002E238572|nr:MurR/RpiR family transcriptional regulator [Sutcliffiella cohnii]